MVSLSLHCQMWCQGFALYPQGQVMSLATRKLGFSLFTSGVYWGAAMIKTSVFLGLILSLLSHPVVNFIHTSFNTVEGILLTAWLPWREGSIKLSVVRVTMMIYSISFNDGWKRSQIYRKQEWPKNGALWHPHRHTGRHRAATSDNNRLLAVLKVWHNPLLG